MTCHDCQELLQQWLDGETVADPALAAHLAACEECRALHAAAQRLQAGVRLLPLPLPPAELATRVVCLVLAQQRAARRRRFTLAAAVAVAAAVLLAIFVGYVLPSRDEGTPLPPQNIAEQQPEQRRQQEAVSLRESMTDIAQLTLRRADETLRTLLPGANATETTPSPMSSPVDPLREAGSSVSAGLEPVADSARRAWNLLLRELPPRRAEDKRGS
jgi:hypothetical protein